MKARINGSDPVDVTAFMARSQRHAEAGNLSRWDITVTADLSRLVDRHVRVVIVTDDGTQAGEGVVTSAVYSGAGWACTVEGSRPLVVEES